MKGMSIAFCAVLLAASAAGASAQGRGHERREEVHARNEQRQETRAYVRHLRRVEARRERYYDRTTRGYAYRYINPYPQVYQYRYYNPATRVYYYYNRPLTSREEREAEVRRVQYERGQALQYYRR